MQLIELAVAAPPFVTVLSSLRMALPLWAFESSLAPLHCRQRSWLRSLSSRFDLRKQISWLRSQIWKHIAANAFNPCHQRRATIFATEIMVVNGGSELQTTSSVIDHRFPPSCPFLRVPPSFTVSPSLSLISFFYLIWNLNLCALYWFLWFSPSLSLLLRLNPSTPTRSTRFWTGWVEHQKLTEPGPTQPE